MAGEPESPVGNTGVASMWQSENLQNSPRVERLGNSKSAQNLILTISRRSVEGLGASASIVQLVESLVWPFVAHRSLRAVWFSDKEFDRFVNSMRITARRLIEVSSEDNHEQSYLKYWLDSYLCLVFRDSQKVPRDSWITTPLFSGWLKRCVLRAIAKRDVSFIYSLQKGAKRAWPALGEVKKKQALDKHMQRLSECHGTLPDDLEGEITRTSLSIFKKTNQRPTEGSKFMPSGSACLQASRRDGGALSLIKRYTMPLEGPEAAKIGKLPVLNATVNSWRQSSYDQVYAEAVKRITAVDDTGHVAALDVEVVAVPEPGKFRIITKGDGYLYSALQPLQSRMLSDWKGSRAATMLDEDLTERIRQIDHALPDLPLWCSVDYEAATDLLKRDATFAVFRPLYDAPLSDLAWAGFFAGRAKYPDGKVIDAIEGQLMGHPLSFPMLCVINLAVYHTAIRRWVAEDSSRAKLGVRMWDQVLVNGDDMLFKCSADFYPTFIRTATDAGFKISQGKNYLSPDCCMINSQVYRRTSVHRKVCRGQMKRFGYLNMKLVKGVSLKNGDSEATPTQIGKDLSKMVTLCPWTNCAVPAALGRWKNDWFGPTYHPNWYLPVHLGGFGLDPIHAPDTFSVTRSQREFAARFVADPRMALYRRKGMNIPTAKLAGGLCHWRMVPGDYVEREGESRDVDDLWLERLAYAARAHQGAAGVSDKIFVNHFRPQYRLKPMSELRLLSYWNAQVFAFSVPPCPPIGSIKLKRTLFD
jgi:hypothetical protein